MCLYFFFFNYTATTEIYTYCHTLSLHDALPISRPGGAPDALGEEGAEIAFGPRRDGEARRHRMAAAVDQEARLARRDDRRTRSEEHTSELQSLMRISYAVFCLKKKKQLIINSIYIYINKILIMTYTHTKT